MVYYVVSMPPTAEAVVPWRPLAHVAGLPRKQHLQFGHDSPQSADVLPSTAVPSSWVTILAPQPIPSA